MKPTQMFPQHREDTHGNFIFDERRVTLADILFIAEMEFHGAHPDQLYFPKPDHSHHPHDLIFGKLHPEEFRSHHKIQQASLKPQITLSQIMWQVKSLPHCNTSKVKFFWDTDGFYVRIHK